jgi:hypothetical protein
MREKRTRLVVLTVTLLSLAPFGSVAEQGLANCTAQFPGDALSNAPTLRNTPPDAPAAGNLHLCRRSGDISFFAFEYDPQRYAPVWVAYRISDTFGENGCASMARARYPPNAHRRPMPKPLAGRNRWQTHDHFSRVCRGCPERISSSLTSINNVCATILGP